jgi:argininosuccinate lyase
VRVESDTMIAEIRQAQSALASLAFKHKNAIMPGITHLQHAQPVLFAHALLAYHDMLERDARRLADAWGRADVSPLGAGALAGSSLPIIPDAVANELGFTGMFMNSIDAVSDRGFCAEFTAACSFVMMHLSQMAEMLILWSTPEFGFVELPDKLCTSSSLMPQKKNPDLIELVRGKAGSVIGALVSILTTLKGLPLGYNRDLQEAKRPMFEAADTTRACLKAMTLAFSNLVVHEDRMLTEASDSQMLATDLAEHLVSKGVPFREAHAAIGRLAKHCAEKQIDIAELTLKDFKKFHAAFERDVLEALSPQASVKRRSSPGGTGTEEVHKRLAGLKERNSNG